MQVELYEDQEVAYLSLLEELGLSEQLKRCKRDSERPTRHGYREMTDEELAVFSVLCPVKTAVSDYSQAPIPLRVLEALQRAKPHFEKIEVWHPNYSSGCPLLVGVNKHANGWQSVRYLIARWGAELDEWPALVRCGKYNKRPRVVSMFLRLELPLPS